MRVKIGSGFDREWSKTPAPIREWAKSWIDAAKSPDATVAGVLDGAMALKGGNFRNCHVRKWRRKIPHGEYRLVFKVEAEEEKVIFVHLGPREDDYKTAARRARAMQKPKVV